MNFWKIPKRKKYNDEKKYSWLSILLDSLAINDHETDLYIRREAQIKQLKIACHKGCSNCCVIEGIPISELELRGISWYTSEMLDYDIQEKIKLNIFNKHYSIMCPFLIDNACSIYEIRPLACRSLYVFNNVCEWLEEPLTTRPNEVLIPSRTIAKKVAMRFLDEKSYRLNTQKNKIEAFENGVMAKDTKSMNNIDWNFIQIGITIFQRDRFNK
jgi:Fe-S-cluster containining protein